ncbi:MAG: hypothetical protein NDP13_06275 [Crenarchaeota archaeon]|nr:hypothetical protein [Thermoproteota archaeon]
MQSQGGGARGYCRGRKQRGLSYLGKREKERKEALGEKHVTLDKFTKK